MNIIKAKDYADVSKKAADIMAAVIHGKPDCVLGLATGSTPIGLYQELIKQNKEGTLDFSKVKSVNLDEYIGLDHDNDQSYFYFMHDNLFNHVNIKEENINIPNGTCDDMEAECVRYEEVVDALGGADIQLLGIGHDGHIGFNEPDNHFPQATHLTDLNQMTIEANARFFATMDDVPKKAITMGIGTIMKAKKILLVASGKDKAEIMKKSLFGSVTPEVPASILQFHPDVTVVTDCEW